MPIAFLRSDTPANNYTALGMHIKKIVIHTCEKEVSRPHVRCRKGTLVVDARKKGLLASTLQHKGGVLIVRNNKLFLEVAGSRIKCFASDFCCVTEDTHVRVYVHSDAFADVGSFVRKCSQESIFRYLHLATVLDLRSPLDWFTRAYVLSMRYLGDEPMGIKQNKLVKRYFIQFFVYTFDVETRVMASRYAKLVPINLHYIGLRSYNAMICRIYKLAVDTLLDCMHIFGGRNYNTLKSRIDKMEYSVDVIILASIVFAFTLLILYNIVGFYVLAVLYRAVIAVCELCVATVAFLCVTDFSRCKKNTCRTLQVRSANYAEYKVSAQSVSFYDAVLISLRVVFRSKGIKRCFWKDWLRGTC